MRWDRLFEELEAQGSDLELEERDALVDELRDGNWARTSWRDLLGGRVSLEVVGVGVLEGEVALVNGTLVQLRGEGTEHVVAVRAVSTLRASERRADTATVVHAALGWGHVFRALRDAAEEVRVRLVDGSSRDGAVDVVGSDFVRLVAGSGRGQVVPFDAVAVVSGRT